MIIVTRLNGGQFGVNPDLIQRVESAPDTILTLIDGTKFIIAEPLAEVISLIHEYRSQVLARARELTAPAAEGELGPRRIDDDAGPDTDDGPIAPAVPIRPRGL